MDNNALTHHGTKGMRWGVRRYQNKDGTLTAAGKKRYASEIEKLKERERIVKNYQRTQAKIDKLDAKRKELDEAERLMRGEKDKSDGELEVKKPTIPVKSTKKPNNKVDKKPVEKMTDEELQERIRRLELEKRYTDLQKTRESKDTKKKGESFVGEIAKSSARNIGTQLGTYMLGTGVNKLAKAMGVKNKTVTKKKDDGTEEILEIFEDIVNPKKGQKDK